MKLRVSPWLILVIVVGLMFRLYLIVSLPIKDASIEPIFITDLLGNGKSLNWIITTIFGLLNIFLLWLISLRLFGKRNTLLIPLLYSLSPWTAYLDVSGSIFIFLLTFLLLLFFGIQLTSKRDDQKGYLVIIASVVILFYSHFLMFLIMPIILFVIIRSRFLLDLKSRTFLIVIFILIIPLLVLMLRNKEGIINLTHLHVGLFADPGLINSVRQFQGELGRENIPLIGRVIENKYVFTSEHIIFNALKQFTPGTYFTSQEKLLGFSFSPPVLFGLIIPFIIGLPELISFFKKMQISWLVIFALLLPSILSKQSPDLNKLVLISPVIFFAIALGIRKLFSKPVSKITSMLLVIFFSLMILQSMVILIDIPSSEALRYTFSKK